MNKKYMGYVGNVARIDNASGLLDTPEQAEAWLIHMLSQQVHQQKRGFVVEVLDVYQSTASLQKVTDTLFNPLQDI